MNKINKLMKIIILNNLCKKQFNIVSVLLQTLKQNLKQIQT